MTPSQRVRATLVDALSKYETPRSSCPERVRIGFFSTTVARLLDFFTNPGETFQDLWQRGTVRLLLSARTFSTTLSTYNPPACIVAKP